DGGVPDVGVDLHLERPADDHRLELGVVDVGRDDGPPARHLGADELGIHPLPQGDELHLRGDLAAAGVVHLRDRPRPAQRAAGQGEGELDRAAAGDGLVAAGDLLHAAAGADPTLPQRWQPLVHVDPQRSAGVVDAQRRLTPAEGDLAHRHTDAVAALDIDPTRGREVVAVIAAGGGGRLLTEGAVRADHRPSPCFGWMIRSRVAHTKRRRARGKAWRQGVRTHLRYVRLLVLRHRSPYAGLNRIR